MTIVLGVDIKGCYRTTSLFVYNTDIYVGQENDPAPVESIMSFSSMTYYNTASVLVCRGYPEFHEAPDQGEPREHRNLPGI